MALVDTVYQKLTDEEDARLCDDIGDAACRETPRSFVLILASNLLTKLGDAVASPKTTLAWLTYAVGAPAYVAGFLVPIRESGSMIPQLFIGGMVRRLPRRKWVWVAGSLAQCLCIAGIGVDQRGLHPYLRSCHGDGLGHQQHHPSNLLEWLIQLSSLAQEGQAELQAHPS